MTQAAKTLDDPLAGNVGQTAPLTPMGLGTLLGRIDHEFATRRRIFDLPTGRFWQPDPDIDLSFSFLGRRAASPIGPAAGPHSQLAQNIVLAWLGGSRLFELKTVQILDQLEIARPCIDMQTIGYNIEWSQELTLPQSLTEYVKASMLLDILHRWEPLADHVGDDPGPHVLDMSVGYDLAGISDPRVAAFIEGMRDATAEVDRLRADIPEPFAQFRDLDFSTRLSDSLTLSTFHGCPPDEIEAITKHLIDAHDLDVIVKLNPTLLGYETVAGIINDELGYHDVSVKESAFAEDLQFDRGVELIGELRQYAHQRGHRFGIKLTNTLVVDNAKGWMPEDTMYLSGPPLHVLAMTLLERLADALPGMLAIPGTGTGPGDVLVSFSAGVTKDNLADTVAAGVNPATICSDLLKPGGYGRLAPMLKALTAELGEAGCTDLASFRAHGQARATAAGHRSSVARYVAAIRGDGRAPYEAAGNTKLPRAVDHRLEMFGCVACNFCITVCPNDAFFSVATPDGFQADRGERPARQQYLVWAELCNECGNCMTFCPEEGDPAKIKPRLFTDSTVFDGRTGQGFLVAPGGSITTRDHLDEAAAVVGHLLGTDTGNPLGPARRP